MNIGIGLDIASGGGKPRYLFRDEFTTDRAAGAVNNTSCEPGPGNRATVETKVYQGFSISSGNLVLPKLIDTTDTTGASSCESQSITIARQPGRMVIGNYKISQIAENRMSPALVVSVSSILSTANADHIIGVGNSLITIVNNGNFLSVRSAAGNTYYPSVMILRTNGCAYFGNIAGLWKMLYMYPTGNTATLYFGYVTRHANDYTGYASYLRIPAARWLPQPTVSDGFTTAFGVSDGAGHAETTGIGSGGANVTWTGSTWSVSGGKAYNTPTTDNEKFAVVNQASTANPWIEMVVSAIGAGTAHGIFYNSSSATLDLATYTGMLTYYDGTANLVTEKYLAGTKTTLGSTAITWAASKRLIVRVGVGAATNIDLYYNEAKVGNTLTKDASLTGKYHGMYSTDAANLADSYVCYATDGTTPLNAFIN